MPVFILDLSYVKCPMNLVFVKKAIYDGKFQTGGIILINDATAKTNIAKYLILKQLHFKIFESSIEIIAELKQVQ